MFTAKDRAIQAWKLSAVAIGCSLLAAACSALQDEASSEGTARESGLGSVTTVAEAAEVDGSEFQAEPALVYVSVGGDKRLAVLQLDTAGGLVPLSQSVDLPGPAGAMVYSESKRQLYVGTGNAIATVALDDAGAPSLLGVTPVEGEPVYLDLSAADEVLAAAFFGEDEIRSYSLTGGDPNTYPVLQTDPWDVEPHAIVVNADSSRAYAPHRNGNSVGVYEVDPAGTMTRLNLARLEETAGPRHIALSPDSAHAYVVNEFGDSVDAYRIGSDGDLTPVQSIPTLPPEFDSESNTGADIHITPNGAFVYASNRGHDSLAMFAVSAEGQLRSLGQIQTQARPREFDISPDGRFIVAAGQDSGQVESYMIGDDGLLSSLGSVPVGEGPVWVTIV